MKQYFGQLNDKKYTITPTRNRTENNEVKCEVSWDDMGTDFIWFDETADELICQLNSNIRVKKETA